MKRDVMGVGRRIFQSVWLCLAAVAAQPALAQTPTLHGLTGIQIEYKEPTNQAHRPLYERLKRRTVLEQYQEFMSPLKFKRLLRVSLSGCSGDINAFYAPGERRITYCYEYIVHMQRRIAETEVLPGFRREDAVVGEFVNTMLHETGHALFHMFDIPVFGREEDAADAVASFVALRVGPMTARRILSGTAFAWRAADLWRQKNRNAPRSFVDYADEHGTEAQRFFNTLCVALGSDTVERTNTFSDFAALLPERRRAKCRKEYLHVKNAFARYVLPHVDQNLMQKVRARDWIRSEDGSEASPPGPLGPQEQPGPSPGPNNPRPPTFGPTPR
jgi:hypothetical protein